MPAVEALHNQPDLTLQRRKDAIIRTVTEPDEYEPSSGNIWPPGEGGVVRGTCASTRSVRQQGGEDAAEIFSPSSPVLAICPPTAPSVPIASMSADGALWTTCVHPAILTESRPLSPHCRHPAGSLTLHPRHQPIVRSYRHPSKMKAEFGNLVDVNTLKLTAYLPRRGVPPRRPPTGRCSHGLQC